MSDRSSLPRPLSAARADSRPRRPDTDETAAPVLTRAFLETGGAVALARCDDPDGSFPSEVTRAASLDAFLKHRPPGDLWVFGYGSLIWNPAMKIAESRVATVTGWHRAFCLSMTAGRGTAARPGLALGLDRGGTCRGIAFRLSESDLASELPLLWQREMLLGGYVPQWVEVLDGDDAAFGQALTFTIDQNHRHYAGKLSQRARLERLATAAGSWGSAADYLFRTVEALRGHGIRDMALEETGKLVEAALLLSFWPQAA
ncbi:gamma-glutamylcyclotransferase (plasmid) [Pseudosulfitobacter pseudonitzschiae]|nr:gamma-glutamylcyclotransferase [Pseudosulfitobacter pseudonitzschiae]